MNSRSFLLSALCLLPSLPLAAEDAPPAPPPVTQVSVPPSAPAPSEEQALYAPPATLIAPEQARAIVDKFKDAYARLGSPRFLIYVNRALVDAGGLKLTHRTEHTDVTRTMTKNDGEPAPAAGAATTAPAEKGVAETRTEHVTAENNYAAEDAPQPTLADKQTVRDVERLFGRPLRIAGATLVDQATTLTLLGTQPIGRFHAAGNERAALEKSADVVIEILISSRPLTVAEVSGDQTYNVPDIQATAIRLKDSVILGQASASDVLGKAPQAARIARTFDVSDVAEATALALMEDMTLSAK